MIRHTPVSLLWSWVCVLGEGCGPEAPVAFVLREEPSLSNPLWSRCATTGTPTNTESLNGTWLIVLPFWWLLVFHFRLFWVSVTSWQLIPTSYTCGIPAHLAHCSSHPAPNCRGRCWLSYAHTPSVGRNVKAKAEVRQQAVCLNLST